MLVCPSPFHLKSQSLLPKSSQPKQDSGWFVPPDAFPTISNTGNACVLGSFFGSRAAAVSNDPVLQGMPLLRFRNCYGLLPCAWALVVVGVLYFVSCVFCVGFDHQLVLKFASAAMELLSRCFCYVMTLYFVCRSRRMLPCLVRLWCTVTQFPEEGRRPRQSEVTVSNNCSVLLQ
jgi:hypothetical protein